MFAKDSKEQVGIMEKTEIFEKIKRAELETEDKIKKAEEFKKNKIFEAKIQARKIIEDAENEAIRIRNEMLEKAKKDIETQKQDIRRVKSKEIEEVEVKGKSNIWKAVDYLYNEFVRAVEHA